jgi:hypothetical protein
VLSPALNRLLSLGQTEEIRSNMSLKIEAGAAMSQAKAAATYPAGEAGVMEIIGRRFATFPQPERGDGEWAGWWQDYFDALSGEPYESLEAAMREYVREPDAEFIPKPGKLLDLSRKAQTEPGRLYAKLQSALHPAGKQYEPPPQRAPPSEAEKAAVKRMMAEYAEKMAARVKTTAKRSDPPATHGKADETGLTPEMRALMTSRQER